MPTRPWFPCYTHDFLGSPRVAAMTTEQIGAYMLLLMYQWNDAACTLPNDERTLRHITRINPNRWKRMSGPVLACFEPHATTPNRIHNPRLMKLFFEFMKVGHERAMAASNRWKNKKRSDAIASGLHMQRTMQTDASHSQSHTLKERTPPTPQGADTFTLTAQEPLTQIYQCLNETAGTAFKARNPSGTLTKGAELAQARLKDGYAADTICAVIRAKCSEWNKDPVNKRYLRPTTLFHAAKFTEYEGALPPARPTATHCTVPVNDPTLHRIVPCGQVVLAGSTQCRHHSKAAGGLA